ncbi:hypothetical protein [Ketogulonicigenium vulgare]|uniref:hypothetical protein n=1 Tax=Ketogulonicigenium vulgare TaxID=92945 RepID=UPI00235A4520|nr:hypothetical protein [Ketogulonicigenium vulgare]
MAQPAYDVLLTGGVLPAIGMGAWAIVKNRRFLIFGGFGWLHIQEEDVPVVELPPETPDDQLRALAWREVAASLAHMRLTVEARVRMIKALAQLCPPEALSLVGLPASRDLTALRRQLKLRPTQLEKLETPSIFEQAKARLG